jgi:ATP phosphoribosyltransferase
VTDVRILRPQEIPTYVAEGLYDVGVTGRDWIEETASDVVSLGQLRYSKNTERPFSIVLAVADDAPWRSVEDLPDGVRVSTEYPQLATRYLADRGVRAEVRLSYGATEAKVPDVADAVVEGTETGRTLRAAGLRIVDTVLDSYTELIANPRAAADPVKRHAMGQLRTLLDGALEARGRVLLKCNVPVDSLDKVIELLPSMKAPTVSQLFGSDGYAVETVVQKSGVNVLIPALRDAGATDILELPLSKIVP